VRIVQIPTHGSATPSMRTTFRPMGAAALPRSFTPHSIAVTARAMIDSPSVTMITANSGRPSIGRKRNRSHTSATTTSTAHDTPTASPHGSRPEPTTTM